MDNILTAALTDAGYAGKTAFSVGAFLAVLLFSYMVKRALSLVFSNVGRRISHESVLAKTRTVRQVLYNVFDVVLFFIALMVVLSQWGVNVMPILTGAGILGLAVSFGAQTLVKDIIGGFFILVEDQFNVGDRVKILTFEGTVSRITLRMTVLRDKNNNLIYIPNSQITTVMRYGSKDQ